MKLLNLFLAVIALILLFVGYKVAQVGPSLDRAQAVNQHYIEAQKALIASNAHLEETLLSLKEEINKTSDKFAGMTSSSSDLEKTIAGLKEEIGKVSSKIK